jgi:hypothetical protein
MLPRRIVAATTFALLVFAAPAAAAPTAAAGPSATPLILELGLAGIVLAALAVRRPAGRLLAASRRRLTGARPGRAVAGQSARARARS